MFHFQFIIKKLPPGKRELNICQLARYLHFFTFSALFNYFYVKSVVLNEKSSVPRNCITFSFIAELKGCASLLIPGKAMVFLCFLQIKLKETDCFVEKKFNQWPEFDDKCHKMMYKFRSRRFFGFCRLKQVDDRQRTWDLETKKRRVKNPSPIF